MFEWSRGPNSTPTVERSFNPHKNPQLFFIFAIFFYFFVFTFSLSIPHDLHIFWFVCFWLFLQANSRSSLIESETPDFLV